jgi:hypothetical protein
MSAFGAHGAPAEICGGEINVHGTAHLSADISPLRLSMKIARVEVLDRLEK